MTDSCTREYNRESLKKIFDAHFLNHKGEPEHTMILKFLEDVVQAIPHLMVARNDLEVLFKTVLVHTRPPAPPRTTPWEQLNSSKDNWAVKKD